MFYNLNLIFLIHIWERNIKKIEERNKYGREREIKLKNIIIIFKSDKETLIIKQNKNFKNRLGRNKREYICIYII